MSPDSRMMVSLSYFSGCLLSLLSQYYHLRNTFYTIHDNVLNSVQVVFGLEKSRARLIAYFLWLCSTCCSDRVILEMLRIWILEIGTSRWNFLWIDLMTQSYFIRKSQNLSHESHLKSPINLIWWETVKMYELVNRDTVRERERAREREREI